MPLSSDPEVDAIVRSSGKMLLLHKLLPKLRAEGRQVLVFSQFKVGGGAAWSCGVCLQVYRLLAPVFGQLKVGGPPPASAYGGLFLLNITAPPPVRVDLIWSVVI